MKHVLLIGLAMGVLAWLPPTASAATTCSLAGDTLTIGFTNSTGVVVRRDTPPSTTIRVQEFQVAGFVNCGATTPTVENTNTVNITDNSAGTNTSAQLDLTNGPFRDAGGAEIEFGIDLNDGSDGFFLGDDPGAMNFRFGTFLGVPFVNRNAGTDNTPDTIVRDTETFTAFGETQGDVFTTLGPPGTGDPFTAPMQLFGDGGSDNLAGGDANDTIVGGGGDDSSNGGPGSDDIRGDAGTDAIEGGPNPPGRANGDLLTYIGQTTPVSVSLATTAPQNTGPGSGVDTITGVERVEGGNAASTLTGNDQDNELLGRGGDDLLEGRGGDDLLDGNGGVNTASYENAPAAVTVNLGTAGPQATGGAGTDTLDQLTNLRGSQQGDLLTGGPTANVISALGGNDNVQVRDGVADTVDCGDGTDNVTGDAVDAFAANCETVDPRRPGAGVPAGGVAAILDRAVRGTFSARRTQDIIKQKAVLATAACAQETCTASGTGSLNVPRPRRPVLTRRFRLKRARASLPAAARKRLRLRLSRRTLRRARLALRRGARVSAKVRITVRDAAGNTASRTFRVRAKRPKKRR